MSEQQISVAAGLPPGADYSTLDYLGMLTGVLDVLEPVVEAISELPFDAKTLVDLGLWRALCERCREAEALQKIRIGEVDYELCPFCVLDVGMGVGCG